MRLPVFLDTQFAISSQVLPRVLQLERKSVPSILCRCASFFSSFSWRRTFPATKVPSQTATWRSKNLCYVSQTFCFNKPASPSLCRDHPVTFKSLKCSAVFKVIKESHKQKSFFALEELNVSLKLLLFLSFLSQLCRSFAISLLKETFNNRSLLFGN